MEQGPGYAGSVMPRHVLLYLPVVVSHSTMMPPLCLPHSYYEVASLKKTKKGGGFFFFLCIHGVKTIQIFFNGSQHDTVNSHHRVEFVGGN